MLDPLSSRQTLQHGKAAPAPLSGLDPRAMLARSTSLRAADSGLGRGDVFRVLDNISPVDNSFGGFLIPSTSGACRSTVLRLSYHIPKLPLLPFYGCSSKATRPSTTPSPSSRASRTVRRSCRPSAKRHDGHLEGPPADELRAHPRWLSVQVQYARAGHRRGDVRHRALLHLSRHPHRADVRQQKLSRRHSGHAGPTGRRLSGPCRASRTDDADHRCQSRSRSRPTSCATSG